MSRGALVGLTLKHSRAHIFRSLIESVCFGTELTGASDALIAQSDLTLRIPMYGFTESYNISVSAAITLYTVMERLRASSIDWRLSADDLARLKLSWARKVVHSAAHLEERIRAEEATG